MERALPLSQALTARLSRKPLAIFLDIDGTLVALAPRPDEVVVSPDVLSLVRDLSRVSDVHVAVVTGRSVPMARKLVPLDHIGVIGNHGFEILGEDGGMIVNAEAQRFRPAMSEAAQEIGRVAARHSGLILEDKIWTLSLHYRLAPRELVPEVTDAVQRIAAAKGLVTTGGKEIIEVRPPIDVNKGTAAVDLGRRLGALGSGTALYIGDDRTDEDAFHALRAVDPNAVTVRVGHPGFNGETHAEFGVDSPDEVRVLLEAVRDSVRR
jgi:trehalose 6-phosphate phosphatase